MTTKKTAKKAPAKKAPAKKATKKKSPSKKAPAKKTPKKKAPAKKTPKKKTPSKKAPAKKAPPKKAPAKKGPKKKAPAKKALGKTAPVNEVMAKQTVTEDYAVRELEAARRLNGVAITIEQIIDNMPASSAVVVFPERDSGSIILNLRNQLQRFYQYINETVARISRSVTCRSSYLSESFQPRPLQRRISDLSYRSASERMLQLSEYFAWQKSVEMTD